MFLTVEPLDSAVLTPICRGATLARMVSLGGRPVRFRFGAYEADVERRELRKHGLRMHLRVKSFEVLAALLEHFGEIVTRDELRRRLWPEGVFVDFENSLNSAVNRLRDVLGDSSAKPRFIETLPRMGYRFIAKVEPLKTAFPRLAVLPFENLNRDPEQDFFADGVADALTTALGNVSTLRVISRQSMLRFRGSRKTAPEIARELKADAIVEGSVLQAGGRVRITAQLVQAAPDQHLWAKSYECEVGDILTVQGQVARAIAEAVQVVLTPAEIGQLGRSRRVDPEAQVAYLKALQHMSWWSREGLQKGLEHLLLALEKDQTHALALAHLAECYGLLGLWGHLPPAIAFSQAREAAMKALALDDGLSVAHWSLGNAALFRDWDLVTCETEARRAIELNPSDQGAHVLNALLLAIRGDEARAAAEATLAVNLDPLSLYVNTSAAWVYLWVKEYGRAAEQARRTLDLFHESLQAYYVLGLVALRGSRYGEAIDALEKAVKISPDPMSIAYLGAVQARAGRADLARSTLQDLLLRSEREHVSPRCFVFLYAGLGEQDRALEWLERTYEGHDSGVLFLRVMPLFDPLRGTERFEKMVRRLGLKHQ